jgi:hypothetical protein
MRIVGDGVEEVEILGQLLEKGVVGMTFWFVVRSCLFMVGLFIGFFMFMVLSSCLFVVCGLLLYLLLLMGFLHHLLQWVLYQLSYDSLQSVVMLFRCVFNFVFLFIYRLFLFFVFGFLSHKVLSCHIVIPLNGKGLRHREDCRFISHPRFRQ